MKKFSVLAFCIFAVAITVYGLVQPSYHLQQLISLETGYAFFRVASAAVLAIYMFVPRVRTDFAKILMRVLGVMLLSFGATTFVSPTFMGSFWSYVPLGDVFISIEGGILALFLSMRLPAGQSALFIPWRTFKGQLASPQKLLPAVSSSKAKAA